MWLEEELIGHQFIDHTAETPDIGVVEIVSLNDCLWGTIFSGLDSVSEVFFTPTSITEINNLESEFFI